MIFRVPHAIGTQAPVLQDKGSFRGCFWSWGGALEMSYLILCVALSCNGFLHLEGKVREWKDIGIINNKY